MSRISIVLPNYNHEQFVGKAINSLLSQTRPPDEIFIIDDASTDDSVAVIEKHAGDRADVTILQNDTNLGVLKTLNRGLTAATGDFVAFPAADDMLRSDFLEKTERMLERFPDAAFCSACVEIIDEQGRASAVRPILRPALTAENVSAQSARLMLERGDNFFFGNVTLYRRHRLLELGGFDSKIGGASDGMMTRRMAVRWGCCFIPKVLGAWRLHDANYSASPLDSLELMDRIIAGCQQQIASEPPGLFPENYVHLVACRMRFGFARIALLRRVEKSARSENADLIRSIIRGSTFDWWMLALLQHLGWLGRHLSVAWIATRLRPFSFSWLGVEALRRLVSRT